MFVIERKVAKNGKPYIAIFPDGGKCPLEGTINNFPLLSKLLHVDYATLASVRKNGAMRLEFYERNQD